MFTPSLGFNLWRSLRGERGYRLHVNETQSHRSESPLLRRPAIFEVKRAPSLRREGSGRASLDLTTRHLAVKRAHRHPPRPSPVVRGEGSKRGPPVCKWGVLRASSREGNCVWVKYEEALSPVCIRRGRVSSSDLIVTDGASFFSIPPRRSNRQAWRSKQISWPHWAE